MNGVNFYDDPTCLSTSNYMLFAFPGPSLGGATTDAFTLTATTTQTLQNLNCYQCVHPMIMLGEALTTTITNTIF